MSSIRQLLADVLQRVDNGAAPDEVLYPDPEMEWIYLKLADALLASPLAAIIDLAALNLFPDEDGTFHEFRQRWLYDAEFHAQVYALLAEWRASRAERPTP